MATKSAQRELYRLSKRLVWASLAPRKNQAPIGKPMTQIDPLTNLVALSLAKKANLSQVKNSKVWMTRSMMHIITIKFNRLKIS